MRTIIINVFFSTEIARPQLIKQRLYYKIQFSTQNIHEGFRNQPEPALQLKIASYHDSLLPQHSEFHNSTYFNIYPNTFCNWLKHYKGRAIAQAVSRRLPTAAARVQTRVWSCGILWWTKVALGQVFSENFCFHCQSTFHLLLHYLHYHPRLAQ
jgi:hypothetical protein